MDAYVCLGSNVEDAEARLEEACSRLAALPDLRVVARSPVYLTEPQLYREQAWFANLVVRLDCGGGWTPSRLVDALLEQETRMGRTRSPDPALRYGPRVIDMDLLLFGDCHQTDPHCTVPHPRMEDRAFVLVPLRDIAPEVMLLSGKTPGAALACLSWRLEGRCIYQ